LILWGLGEIAFRVLVAVRSAGYPTAATMPHPVMGWTAKPNFVFDGPVKDGAGEDYEIHFATDENSFRFFDDPQTSKKKLLVFGDSYTHAIEVSNDKTYYGLLQDSLEDIVLFAFGARGIGPLQESLWLQEWYDQIQPDFVLWQFCFNDIFNSSYDLESTSYFNNNRLLRPYLKDGKIIYRNPARLGLGGLREVSKFLDFILTKAEVIIESGDHKKGIASEDQIQKNGKNYVPYQTALNTVDQVVKIIKNKIGNDIPVLAMQTDLTEPFISDIREIFENNGITVVKSAAELIDLANKNGQSVWAKDLAHWNELGHAIAAKEVWPALKKMIFPVDSVGVDSTLIISNN
jgi:hypothetical protein